LLLLLLGLLLLLLLRLVLCGPRPLSCSKPYTRLLLLAQLVQRRQHQPSTTASRSRTAATRAALWCTASLGMITHFTSCCTII
jgi:hypothetical protein